jgi:acetyl-CoA acyltransferase
MRTAYILAAYRTPGCKAKKGKLRDVRPDDLAAHAMKWLLERTAIDPMLVDDIIIGCAFPEAEQGMNMARIAALRAGIPYQVPAQTVNRFCSSGLQTIASAAERIMSGFADCIIAGGAESMSMIPMGGNKYSVNPFLEATWPESFSTMGITAELVADKYHVSRADQDAFAVSSHRKAAAAIEQGKFKEQIVPVEVEHCTLVRGKMKREKKLVTIDDGVRADTTPEILGKL